MWRKLRRLWIETIGCGGKAVWGQDRVILDDESCGRG